MDIIVIWYCDYWMANPVGVYPFRYCILLDTTCHPNSSPDKSWVWLAPRYPSQVELKAEFNEEGQDNFGWNVLGIVTEHVLGWAIFDEEMDLISVLA